MPLEYLMKALSARMAIGTGPPCMRELFTESKLDVYWTIAHDEGVNLSLFKDRG